MKLIPDELLTNTLEAIKASQLDMIEKNDLSSVEVLSEIRESLEEILDSGLKLDDGPTDEEYIKTAEELYGEDGKIEIDDGAIVSRGDDPGAYVQAWVWVYKADVDPKYEEEE
jgi:hypothetical protein